jgi:sigma54-dependent transcription regulator
MQNDSATVLTLTQLAAALADRFELLGFIDEADEHLLERLRKQIAAVRVESGAAPSRSED